MKTPSFDPFTYQPMMRHYYNGAVLPQIAAKATDIADKHPEVANHVQSTWQFISWMKDTYPELYSVISGTRPDLLDPGSVVLSGDLAPNGKKSSNLKGLGDGDSNTPITADTSWGQQIADFAKQYLLLDQQRKIMDMNIKRAEQGLQPIDNVGAAVNVGLTQDVQKLAMVAIGGIVLVGLAAAFRRK